MYIYIYVYIYMYIYICLNIYTVAQCFSADALPCLSFASHASCRPCITHTCAYVCIHVYHKIEPLMCFSCIMSSLYFMSVHTHTHTRTHTHTDYFSFASHTSFLA